MGEGVEFLSVGNGFEGETKADKAMLLGDGGAVAIVVGEDGKGLA